MKKGKLHNLSIYILTLVIVLSVVNFNPTVVNAGDSQVNKTENIVFGNVYKTGAMSDKDYCLYTMTLKKSGRVTLSATNSGAEGGAYIYGEAENDLVGWTIDGNATKTFSVDLLAGTYTLKVRDHWMYSGTANISFRVNFADCNESVSESVTTTNNEIGFETPYVLGRTVNGQLAANDGSDLYRFVVGKNGYVIVTLRSQQLTNYYVELTDEENKVSYKEKIETGAHQLKLFAPKGTYYLTIKKSDGTGTYSFVAKSEVLKATKLKKVKRAKYSWYNYRSMRVKWAKKGDASGYQVQIAKDKKFKKGKKTFEAGTDDYSRYIVPSQTLKKRTYYVRVRYYITSNGHKYFSPWSNAKSIKLK